MTRFMIPLGILLLVAGGGGGSSVGQETADAENPLDGRAFLEAAKEYTIATDSEPDEPFELIPKPLLTWSNPERRTPSGKIFLYTRHGRPQVALCVYPNQGKLDHEFQSLAGEPLLARRDGAVAWAPRTAGIELKSLENVLPPGGTAMLRLREMRHLSRKFEAAILRGDTPHIPLRLLSTPIYRCPSEGLPEGVVDGALFAFVQGTDPEVLLLIEAREEAGGGRRWDYGLGRMSMVVLGVRLDDQEIWRTEWAQRHPDRTYYTVMD